MRSTIRLIVATTLGLIAGCWLSGGRPPAFAQGQAPQLPGPIVIRRSQPLTDTPFPQRYQSLFRPTDLVFSQAPNTEAAARTWLTLNMPIAFPFREDTPLQEVVDYIRKATVDERIQPKGLTFYLDEIGMLEAQEVTPGSSVKLAVERVPLKSALWLMLKQLGLVFVVTEDGLVVITSPKARPEYALPDSLGAVREELLELRDMMESLRPRGGSRRAGGYE